MVRNPVPVALNAFVSGLAVVMTVFTLADISGGDRGTALVLGAIIWPIVAVICAFTARSLHRDKISDDPEPDIGSTHL